eukprot:s4611_g1.t1
MQARPCEVGGKAVLILLMHHDHQFPSAQVEDAWSFFKLLDRDGGGSEPRLICFTEYVVQTKLRAMAQGAVLQAADIRNPDAVEVEEFLKGCLRFRGQARAIDIGQLLHDQGWLLRHQSRFHTYMEMEHQKLKKQISSLTAMLTTSLDLKPRHKPSRSEKEQGQQGLQDENAMAKPRTKFV